MESHRSRTVNRMTPDPTAMFDPGSPYTATERPDEAGGNVARAWTVTGGTEPYTVTLTVRGEWGCSCPHFRYRVGGRGREPCKHVKAVQVQTNEASTGK